VSLPSAWAVSLAVTKQRLGGIVGSDETAPKPVLMKGGHFRSDADVHFNAMDSKKRIKNQYRLSEMRAWWAARLERLK